jgi:zinc transport system substrate-binding protein
MAAGDDEHADEAGAMDPHVWLDPHRAIILARNVQAELASLDPGGAATYGASLRRLTDDLEALDRRLRAQLARLRGTEVLVFHPAFGYFCDAYGLRQVAIEHEGKEPDARQLAGVIANARAGGVKVVFVQPAFSDLAARAVAAEIGGVVVPLDDLARDYLGNMERVARTLSDELPAAPGKASP